MAAVINADPGTVAVLPAGTMRQFSWSGPAPVLDPLPRWVRADVLTTGDLTISGATVPGEGDHAREVQAAVASRTRSRRAHPRRGGVAGRRIGHSRRHGLGCKDFRAAAGGSTATVTWRCTGSAATAAGAPAGRRLAVLVAHLAWLAMLIVGAVGSVSRYLVGSRRRTD